MRKNRYTFYVRVVKDVVAVSPPSMQDIKDYLAVRTERYRGSNDDTDYVFLTRVNDPFPTAPSRL